MTASEARAKTFKINTGKDVDQYDYVKGLISEAVNNGELSTTYGSYLRTSVKTKLEEEGYNITYYSDFREGSYTEISW